MGFFGDNFDDPRTQGILQAAAAMLGSRGQNFGQSLGAGLQAGIGGYGDAQKIQSAMLMKKAEEAMKQKLMESQIAENESQNQQRAAGIKKQEQLNNLLMSRFGGQQQQQMPQMQDQQNSGIAQSIPLDQQSGAMPQQQIQQAPSAQQGQQQSGKFPFSVNDLAAIKAMGGPDLLDILKYANAGDKRESGSYYTNPMNGQTTYMPKLPEGTTMGPDGKVMGVPGAADANANYQGRQAAGVAAGQSGYKLKDRYDIGTGQTVMDTEANIINKAQGGMPAVAGPKAGDTAYNTDVAKSAAEAYKGIQTAGMQAASKIAKYQQMGKLLQDFEGGKLSGAGLDLSRVANSLGIKIDKNLSNKEALSALSTEIANASREAGSGVFTDKDFENALNAAPNLSQSAAGRKTIIENNIKKLQRDQETAKMAAKWSAKYGRIDAAGNNGKTFQENLNEWYKTQPAYGK